MRIGFLACALALGGCPPAPPPDPRADMAAPGQGTRWLADAVGYQIFFVHSFTSPDLRGDLDGIAAHLDDLAELGVDLLWLTPIHPAPSCHGYDPTDLTAVHPELGGEAAFARLLDGAHRRRMRLLLDLVLNHTSSKHPWFLAAQAGDSERYLFRGDDPGWHLDGRRLWKPLPGATPPRHYYSVFSSALLDMDPRVLPALADALGPWLRRGVDGFRLDAARYLVEWPDPRTATQAPALADTADTHAVWRELLRTAAAVRFDAALLGEVWTDLNTIASYHAGGVELHGCFNFPPAGALLDGVRRGVAQPVWDVLQAMLRARAPLPLLTPFLSNHDPVRTAMVLGSDGAKLRLAAALLLALPGTPFLYYGEEIGLARSDAQGDLAKRAPMRWDEVARQRGDPSSLWRTYQRLVGLRRMTPALRDEGLRVLDAPEPLLALLRGGVGSGRLPAVYNLSGQTAAGATVTRPGDYPAGLQRDLLGGSRPGLVAERRYRLPNLPPRDAAWITAE